MLGDVVTARQAMEKAGVQQDQDSRSLDTLERFKEETTNSINNKDYRRVGDLFIEYKILKYIILETGQICYIINIISGPVLFGQMFRNCKLQLTLESHACRMPRLPG